ncbi:hypothetical protein M885DRAFT_521895 [Pelagophyceae sp. CCMP2097]|nr:hypothetical protein M885DRAFT_521895 [Pelagophyceae sp. CCMP2097]|mmetsp:Transcript_8674/g.28547  ORF Transcript_8674/g.28547 Transcript_8674/m.28547 type:complete len:135 (-) Transcript_8674:189-593(-)
MAASTLRALVMAALAFAAVALVPAPLARKVSRGRRTELKGFMDAFKNDPAFDKKDSAGLTGGAKPMVDVTICGKKMQALPGQKMKDLVRAARAPIKFNCENGDCGTCESLVNGRVVRICKYVVPNKGPVEIKLK